MGESRLPFTRGQIEATPHWELDVACWMLDVLLFGSRSPQVVFQATRKILDPRPPLARSQRRAKRRNQQSPSRQIENLRLWPDGESRLEKNHPPDERQ